jgi:hypothetical protein
MIPYGQGVDNCSLRFGRNGGLFDLRVSIYLTKILQRNLVSHFHQFWAYVYTFGLGLMEMMAMAIAMAMVMVMVMAMAMVLVTVIVIIV